MSYSKAHLFPVEDQKTASLAKAIAHPARIAIIRFLMKVGSSEVTRLYRRLPLSAPTIHQHLDFLTERDIVHVDKQPAKALFLVNKANFDDLKLILDGCINEIQAQAR